MTAVGIPMLWMGEEFGEYKRKSEKVTQPQKIAWTLLEKAENRDLFEYYKQLIALRKHNLALQSDNIEFFHEDAQAKLLAYVRWHDQGSKVVVVVNFNEQKITDYCIPNFPNAGHWQDWFTHTELEVGKDGLVTDLQPYTAKICVCQ
jgi:1,4-alpha-glucan branching enzyme